MNLLALLQQNSVDRDSFLHDPDVSYLQDINDTAEY